MSESELLAQITIMKEALDRIMEAAAPFPGSGLPLGEIKNRLSRQVANASAIARAALSTLPVAAEELLKDRWIVCKYNGSQIEVMVEQGEVHVAFLNNSPRGWKLAQEICTAHNSRSAIDAARKPLPVSVLGQEKQDLGTKP